MQAEFVGVSLVVDDAFYARIDDQSGADAAGLMRAVYRRAFQRQSEFRRLDYGVLFGVDGIAHFLTGAGSYPQVFAHTFTPFLAGRYALRRAVISRGQNAFVPDDDGADLAVGFITTAPTGHQLCHIHKS